MGYVRMEAAYALGTIGPEAKAAIPALKKAAEDRNVNVHLAAQLALWRTTGDENLVQLAVTETVKEGRSGAALGNATAWFASIGASAVPVLLKNLKHPHPRVRGDAAISL